MESATRPGWQTSEFYTMILGNLIGVLLAAHLITPTEASSASNQLPTLGAILLFIVSTAGYIGSRFFLKLRLGPVPQFPTPASSPSPAPPAIPSPAAPSYAPASTGMIPAPPADVPEEAV